MKKPIAFFIFVFTIVFIGSNITHAKSRSELNRRLREVRSEISKVDRYVQDGANQATYQGMLDDLKREEARILSQLKRLKKERGGESKKVVEKSTSGREPAVDSKEATSVSGFFDAQFQWNDTTGQSPYFSVADGAVYLNQQLGSVEAAIDIPFSWGGSTDSDGDGVIDTSDNTFTLATAKSQAYVTHNLFSWLNWTFGQFDTIYGFELNDTKDIFFTNPGIVFNGFLPVTHTGLLLTFTFGDASMKALVSNPLNQGGISGRQNFEFGAQFGFSPGELFRLAAGVLTLNQAAGMRTLYDVVLGSSFGDFALDLEFDALKVGGVSTTGVGLMLHGTYSLSSRWGLGLRPEWTHNQGSDTSYSLAVGPNYALNELLKLKLDYTWSSVKATSDDSFVPSSLITFATVVSL